MKLSINHLVFKHIVDSPNIFQTANLTLLYKEYDHNCLGFVLPKRLGLANLRNCFKRRCRNVFNNVCSKTNTNNCGVVIKNTSLLVSYNEIIDVFNNLGSLKNKTLD